MKASSQMAVYSFLLLSKIHVNSVLKFPVALMSEWMQQGQYRSVRYNNDDV